MKTIKHEIKLERSVKIILGVLALGIFLNAFATPIAQELFGIKDAQAFSLNQLSAEHREMGLYKH